MPKAPPAPPPQVAELVECLGVEGTLKLIEARGGVRIFVPKPANIAESWLADILEPQGLQKLAQAFGATEIAVPLCREWRARLLLHAGGRSQADIARMVGATESWINKLALSDWTPRPRVHKGRAQDARPQRQMNLALD